MTRLRNTVPFFAFAFTILLTISSVHAVSMGSSLKYDTTSVQPGDTAVFNALFWNVDEDPYVVEIEVKGLPEGWTVVANPDEFLLDSSTGSELVYLPYLERSIKATNVEIFVITDSDDEGGEIILSARNKIVDGGDINFVQERRIVLKVDKHDTAQVDDVPGVVDVSVPEDIVVGSGPVEGSQNTDNVDYFFYAIVAIGILAVSVAIYRYA